MYSRQEILPVILAAALALAGAPDPDGLRYNQVAQKASHNSYQRRESVPDQLARHQARTIEFDLHLRTPNGRSAPNRDWFVYHTGADHQSSCNLLTDCLQLAYSFHRQVPRHQIVTVFFDVNDLGGPGHNREDFYAAIRAAIPPAAIVKPADLLAACPGAAALREAVTRQGCGWPRLGEVRGKFLFVVAGGARLFRPGYDPRRDLVFLTAGDVTGGIDEDPERIFFNMSGPRPFIREVAQAGLVSRVYRLDNRESYLAARRLGANLLATDCIDLAVYPWTAAPGDPAEGALPFMPLP